MAIKKLKDMKPGESGLIVTLHGSGNVKHRLIDMGLVHGTKIHVMKFAPLGDPHPHNAPFSPSSTRSWPDGGRGSIGGSHGRKWSNSQCLSR